MKIIIPMSGIGKRFLEAGYTDPKPLIQVDGRPIIHHVIDLFPGETDFVFICNDLHLNTTTMRQQLLEKIPNAVIYSVSVENRRGPVDAVLQIASAIPDDEEVIVSYCDYGTQWDYTSFLQDMRSTAADGGIAAYIGFHPHMLGTDNYAFVKHTDMWVSDIREKQPFTENRMEEYASNGTYYFRTAAIMKRAFQTLVDRNMQVRGEFYVSLAYRVLLEQSLRVRVFEIQKMLQWGTPKDLEEYTMWSSYFKVRKENPLYPKKYPHVTTLFPMAGSGSRFHMVGYTDPKPLLPVHDEPMFLQAYKCLPESGSTVFVCQQSHVDTYPIRAAIQKIPNSNIVTLSGITEGQACTCEIGIQRGGIPLDRPLLISACDNGVYYNVDTYDAMMSDPSIDVIVWAFTNHPTSKLNPQMYAWLDVAPDGSIRDVSIKKPFSEKPNTHCIIGTMYFKSGNLFLEGLKDIYETNSRTNGEFYVDNVLLPLIQKGYSVKVFEVDYYLCWGTPNDYKTYLYWDDYFSTHSSS